MKRVRSSHIRRWLLIYLVVVVLIVTTLSALLFITVTGTLTSATTQQWTNRWAGGMPPAWSGLGLTLFWFLFAEILIICGLGYAWYKIISRKIERPAGDILRALNQLAKGQLNETVAITSPQEFHEMGASINELAANLQELLLYIWKQTGQCMSLLEHARHNTDPRHDRCINSKGLAYLGHLSESIDCLRQMAKSYVFYDVSLDDNKAHAINEPGSSAPSGHPIAHP